MRKLLVVSEQAPSDEVVALLDSNQWMIDRLHTPDSDPQAIDTSRFLVGLAIFPEHRNPDSERQIQRQIKSLPGIKWIAVLAEERLDSIETKQFIAECLYDFQVFPLDGARLSIVLGHAYGMARIERELKRHHECDLPSRFGLIGHSQVMLGFYRMLQRAAESDVSVLINGPTGTGKELAARAIHDHSARSNAPFVAINCAAIPPTLLQSELFGHERGSFTNASARKTGYIQTAAGGTLFLDEIGDMPLESQASLLRFLEDKIITPVGSTRGQYIDVRVIASTNVELERAIQERAFRADLYYRLAFLTVRTPSLDSRGDDIPLLAQHFLAEAVREAGLRDLRISDEAMLMLRHYSWPGNVRELRNVIFQAALSCESLTIRPEDLAIRVDLDQPPPEVGRTMFEHAGQRNGKPFVIGKLRDAREQSEKRNLEFALARNSSNITRTAQDLGVSRMTLYRLMAKHGVARGAATD